MSLVSYLILFDGTVHLTLFTPSGTQMDPRHFLFITKTTPVVLEISKLHELVTNFVLFLMVLITTF